MSYSEFLARKSQLDSMYGFEVSNLPDYLFPFQRDITDWALRKGRAAIFADCGLGKTAIQLAWADRIVRYANQPVLIATPLAVSYQLIAEAEKFGVPATRSIDGTIPCDARVVVTNYDRLHLFDAVNFAGMVCDESSILKNFDGALRARITEFMRRLPYRLLCTATAAPNDYTELGTSSEALGELGHMDMLTRFFRNEQGNSSHRIAHRKRFGHVDSGSQWRFKGHAELAFWRWVCSWARALRRPSDLGYPDDGFVLPPLTEREHGVEARTLRDGMLIPLPAVGLHEQREERRRTIAERCEMVAKLADHSDQVLVWCHLNAEGDLLERLIPAAVQVAGSTSDDEKEERLTAFARGEIRALVTKPKIGAWGLNLQRCNRITFFPSHSYEQYYQGVRRCWRFGQKREVIVDIVSTEGDRGVLLNLKRKAAAADKMFSSLVSEMNSAQKIDRSRYVATTREVPKWIK